ncbi:ISL3 family transposase [Leptolyngbya sp. CCNP1308]|uniref:ISL3 family transposase n=1 Tax=Leptolyngbya sp. CCNP1308 TaxID=3110255 RepID=UPI002B219B63|nr:ISL3 family transposase [Leptolyngbya sp. CCNP1308]MEA5451973.1 ISL3 family transposase [Leptolyngbya sp. CCNP1308]
MVNGGVYGRKKVDIDVSQLRRLGIDEIALRKGHKDFVVVLSDLDTHALIGMAPARTHAAIETVLLAWGSEVLSNIEEVSIDLSGNYRGLVRRLMPQAEIVADRFHVMKLVTDELNQARNAFRRHPEDLPEGITPEAAQAALKNSKYAVLKPEENLTDQQIEKLAAVKAVAPKLALMHQAKETFRGVFDAKTGTQALVDLLDWMATAQPLYPNSVATIRRWLGEILQYFEHRTTSGVVEGINNRLKLIKRSGYGFRNFERFKLRCLISWHFPTATA